MLLTMDWKVLVMLLLMTVVSLCTTTSAVDDPVLLEYSDYYYDLYYGDYNYDELGVHASAPRSIDYSESINLATAVNSPKKSGGNNNNNSKRKKSHHNKPHGGAGNNHSPSTEHIPSQSFNLHPQQANNRQDQQPLQQSPPQSPQQPLNVRLQRLITEEDSAAKIILDILMSSRSSQNRILQFLEGSLDEVDAPAPTQLPPARFNQFTEAPAPPPTRPPPPPPTRPPPPPPTRPPPPPPTRPPPPPPTTRPPPPPPTRPPPPPPTRPPPPPPTRPPPLITTRRPPPPTQPPRSLPTPTEKLLPPAFRESPPSRDPSGLVNSQFAAFPNFQAHLDTTIEPEVPRSFNEKDSGKEISFFDDTRPREDNNKNNNINNRFNNNEPRNEKSSSDRNRFNNNNDKKVEVIDDRRNNFNNRPSKNENRNNVQEDTNSGTSGLTIEEFLDRYPEVKRLSSRFNEDGEEVNKDDVDERAPEKQEQSNSREQQQQQQPRDSRRPHNKHNRKNHNNNNNKNHRNKNVPTATESSRNKPSEITPRQQQQQQTPPPAPPPRPDNPPRETENVPPPPPPKNNNRNFNNNSPSKEAKKSKKHKNKHNKSNNNESKDSSNNNVIPEYTNEYDYYGEYFDYDYYYDQLVPEHERFFQLPKITPETAESSSKPDSETHAEPFQVFTHFSLDSENPAPPPTPPARPPPKAPEAAKAKPPPRRPKKTNKVSPSKNAIAPSIPKSDGKMSGPYGYTEKATFFSDHHVDSFPERIQMVYQGFVWAFDVTYPDPDGKTSHGGIHRILEDKVKRENLNLKGDYIIRITGRASPYNINRLTFYTTNGKVYGPWGDRHSEDSVDFDIRAPEGHALSYFSGTIDFGIPLRSVSFHWKKIP